MPRVLAFAVALLLLVPRSVAADSPNDVVRLNVNPDVLVNLPMWVAVDEGLFAQQHLDVQVTAQSGASAIVIPSLARGDIDVTTLTTNPSFFNQVAQGFDAKIFASGSEVHKGWNPTLWLVERQEVWDAKTIRAPADLRGKRMDGGPPGGTLNYTAQRVIAAGGLTPADLQFSQRFVTPPNWFASLRNNVNDVQSLFEPTVTQIEQEGVGHRWMSIGDVDPTFQENYLAVSGAFLRSHPDALHRFLVAYIKACKQIDDAHGKWTPEIVRILAKWSNLPADVIQRIPTPPYVGEFGDINVAQIEKMEKFWRDQGFVKTDVRIADVVDASFVGPAQKAAGVRR